MIFCHKCGSEQLEGSEFCRKCGARLIAEENSGASAQPANTDTVSNTPYTSNSYNASTPVMEQSYTVQKKSNTKLIVLIVVCVLILAAAGVVIAVILSNNKSDTAETDSNSYGYNESSAEEELKQYSSTKNEISFNYPSNWLSDNSEPNCEVYIYNLSNISYRYGCIELYKFSETQFDLSSKSQEEIDEEIKSFIQELSKEDGALSEMSDVRINSIEQTILGGVSAVKADITYKNENDVEIKSYYYIYDTNNSAYVFICSYRTDDMESKTKINNTINSVKITMN